MTETSGVFVTRVDSDEYEPDDEDGGFAQVLFDVNGSAAGLWKPDPAVSRYDVELPARETIVVLSGTVRIELEGGPTLDLSEGDIASLPNGAVTTWYPSPDFREVWVYS